MSLRGLIITRITASAALVLLIASVITVWQIRSAVEREVKASYAQAQETIRLAWVDEKQTHLTTRSTWQRIVTALSYSRHLEIILLDAFEQERTLISPDTERRDSLPPAWFVALVATDYDVIEYVILLKGGERQRIRISASPDDEIAEAWQETQSYFMTILIMVIVILLSINLLFRSMFRTVDNIQQELRHIASGDYKNRLSPSQILEFDIIAAEINQMTEALQEAHQNNRALAKHSMSLQENERRQLSNDLHDEMGQSLTAIKAMSVALQKPGADVEKIADSISEICNSLSDTLRSMMQTLHPLSLADLGLEATLIDLITDWRKRCPQLQIVIEYDQAAEDLDEETSIHVYRIIQECLTNIVRHANASQANIQLKVMKITDEHSELRIKVSDNGIGGQLNSSGFGLRVMKERVDILNGDMSISSSSDGWRVNVHLPIGDCT